MKGICFIEPLHNKTVKKIKIQTRRIIPNCDSLRQSVFVKSNYETLHGRELKPRYKEGEIVYLKEPYFELPFGGYQYKFEENVSYYRYKNKLFMPASVARYFIKITNLRAERLQKLSYEDCIKEGIFQDISHAKVYWMNGFDGLMYDSPRAAYAALINKINGKGTWERNPYVWVYDYELTKEN